MGLFKNNEEVESRELSVDKNVMYYGTSFIMIKNISSISIKKRPINNTWILALIIGLLSLVCIQYKPSILGGIATLCLVYATYILIGNFDRKKDLNISLNSGVSLLFPCENKEFMDNVLKRLLESVNNEKNNSKYTINFEQCTIGEAFNSSTLS
ncbi:MAG: hypothetical protein IJM37_02195 [Lachnospiraceae bacterium]|nr:hypothetical protein [Lachnospiraceae bacterium]